MYSINKHHLASMIRTLIEACRIKRTPVFIEPISSGQIKLITQFIPDQSNTIAIHTETNSVCFGSATYIHGQLLMQNQGDTLYHEATPTIRPTKETAYYVDYLPSQRSQQETMTDILSRSTLPESFTTFDIREAYVQSSTYQPSFRAITKQQRRTYQQFQRGLRKERRRMFLQERFYVDLYHTRAQQNTMLRTSVFDNHQAYRWHPSLYIIQYHADDLVYARIDFCDQFRQLSIEQPLQSDRRDGNTQRFK